MSRALVSGASSGIGRELARLLARDGHEVILVARRERELRELADEIGGATVLAIDLAERGAVERVVRAAGDVDVLVNNAGFGDYGPFVTSDVTRQLAMIDLNVRALTELTHAYLAGMVRRRFGRVLNVASTAAFQPGPYLATYSATKAFVLSFSEALAEEVRGHGVSVTALCPGPTASGFQSAARMQSSWMVRRVPMPSAASVAEAGYAAMLAGRPVAVVGRGNRLMVQATRVVPRAALRRAAGLVLGDGQP